MFDLLSVAKAWERLHSPDISGMDTENYLQLCKDAGYSEEVSQKAACNWGLQRLRADLPV